tara:strand:- start:7699 stop:8952 length:1254 start_codon:yes stop_codon:yes gene_type:complete
MKLGFVGLSHLGLISSIVASSKGYKVVCFDKDKKKIASFLKGNFEIDEPKLQNIYNKNKSNVHFTFNIEHLKSCKIIYFSQDIITNKKNVSDITTYKKNINHVLKILKLNTIVVILSQVPPGFTDSINWNKKRLFYQVETLIFGKAINRASNPERIIIGTNNLNKLPRIFSTYLNKYNCPIKIMNYKSAEFTKISINLYLVSQITLTNVLSEYINRINGNWMNVADSLRLDRRIGKYSYLYPGLGLSGGNLERDIETVKKIFHKNKFDTSLFKIYKNISERFNNWPYFIFKNFIDSIDIKKPLIGILGLTYKKDTNSIKNSPSIKFIKKINSQYNIIAYDPVIKNLNIKNVKILPNKNNIIEKSNILLILNDWDEFKEIKKKSLEKNISLKGIIDPFNILEGINFNKNKIFYKSLLN